MNPGTPLCPLIAVNCTANAGHKSVPERRFDPFEKKGHRAFRKYRLVTLVKLTISGIDFANNCGTMPHHWVESSQLKLSV
jgi:hypothetical protein